MSKDKTLRILLITPVFYGCEKKIKSLLEESGNEVFWIENKVLPFDYHGTKSKCKIIRRIIYTLFSPQKRYFKNQIKTIKEQQFDVLFSINAHVITSYLIRYLKKQNPALSSVLFLWDSFSMYNWINEIKYFDRVFTFDPKDAKTYNLEYKPNFYIRNINHKISSETYDLFFAGKFNSSRLSVIDILIEQADVNKLKYFIWVWPAYKIFPHNRLLYLVLRKLDLNSAWTKKYLTNYEVVEGILKRKFIMANKLYYEEIQPLLFSSNVILDLPVHGQAGYTHLLIEALANGKKLITTNTDIKKEKFYNPEQICVIDENCIDTDAKWIREKKTFHVDSYFNDLELSSWIKSIFNVEVA